MPQVDFGSRKVREGTVVSDKMEKTVVVAVASTVRHRIYKKIVRRLRHYMAHDEENVAKLGDRVRIVEARPNSRKKRWQLADVLIQADRPEVAPEEIDLELLGEVKAEEPEAAEAAPPAVEEAVVVAEPEQAPPAAEAAPEEPAVEEPSEETAEAPAEVEEPEAAVEETKEPETEAAVEEPEATVEEPAAEQTIEAPPEPAAAEAAPAAEESPAAEPEAADEPEAAVEAPAEEPEAAEEEEKEE
jgi:small subunit ribosomal protein S17